MARGKKTRRGGLRPGAGRPRGTGGPPEKVRRNRVVVMVTDGELAALRRLAHKRDLPVGTVAHEVLRRGLGRRRSNARGGGGPAR